jgi:hypothetical protein
MSSTEERDLEINWEKIRDNNAIKYSGVPVGTIFQFAEHSPEVVEGVTGLDVPSALFEDVFNPHEIDKGVHFYFSYSMATGMLEGMEKAERHFSYPTKAASVNVATLVGGSAKEFTDSFYDPMDMAANLFGSNAALIHHKSRLENKYEQEFGIDIDSNYEFIAAEALQRYNHEDEEFNVRDYLQEAD